MNELEMTKMLEEVLLLQDANEKSWAYARAIVKLGSEEELRMALTIISANDHLHEKADLNSFSCVVDEIKLRRKLTPLFASVDEALVHYPHVAARTKGTRHKVALLAFSNFCSCDVTFACQLLEDVIAEFESGKDRVELRCGNYVAGYWPRNHRDSVLSAMASFTQHPCWVLKYLFLPERGSSGLRPSEGIAFFERKQQE